MPTTMRPARRRLEVEAGSLAAGSKRDGALGSPHVESLVVPPRLLGLARPTKAHAFDQMALVEEADGARAVMQEPSDSIDVELCDRAAGRAHEELRLVLLADMSACD